MKKAWKCLGGLGGCEGGCVGGEEGVKKAWKCQGRLGGCEGGCVGGEEGMDDVRVGCEGRCGGCFWKGMWPKFVRGNEDIFIIIIINLESCQFVAIINN